jgi:hypothetical protein
MAVEKRSWEVRQDLLGNHYDTIVTIVNSVNSRQNNRSLDCLTDEWGSPGRLCTHGALCSGLPNHLHPNTPNRPNVLVLLTW